MQAVVLALFCLFGGAFARCTQEYVIKMSDGVGLTTTIAFPEPCDAKRAAVMDATPYGPSLDRFADTYVPEGFIAVMQNQRGCFTSGGTYNFWKQDGYDHYDTMVWISNQTWYNGQIFASGVSADAISEYSDYIVTNPYGSGGYAMWGSAFGWETSYWNGAFRGGLISHWLLTLGLCPNAPNIEAQVRQNENYTDWWAPLEANGPYGNHFPNVVVPSVHQAGWWDIFAQPQINTVAGILQYGAASIKEFTWLWVIPLGHCTFNADAFPGFEIIDPQVMSVQVFKANWSHPVFSYTDTLNFYVFGPVPAYEKDYTVGNYYTSLPSWPVPNKVNYYVGANGVLSTTAPTTAGSLTYTYDPNNPAPQLSGNNLYGPCGPNDETSNEKRSDYLLWNLTTPFSADTAICGNVTASITVSSDAVDTDFIISVNDIYPTGQSVPVRYGPVRMRWRDSDYTATMMTPGQKYTVPVDMWSICYIFEKGHSMRVTITSSRNPEISVNPNNGLPLSQGLVPPPLIVAKNSVYWGTNQQTFVTLPFVPVSALPVNSQIH